MLVDAPCLGLGLIGRHPEIRWLNRLRDARRNEDRQLDILGQAARFVAPGGRLAWVTCSPTRAENERVIEKWLASNLGY